MTAAGKLPENIGHFARVLREAGIPAGPGTLLDALDAVELSGMRSREDFYWALHAVFVKKREHAVLFAEAFEVFWIRPKLVEQLMQLFFHQTKKPGGQKPRKSGHRRLAEAMFKKEHALPERKEKEVLEFDASFTATLDEVLRAKDFEQMSLAEQAEARAAIAQMRLNREWESMRRYRAGTRGRVDMRRSFRRMLREGGMMQLSFRARRRREPPLVVLADISGSVAQYSRMFLHFLHAVKTDRSRVEVFLFGTRLTHVTRELERRDVDEAMAKVAGAVKDWSGGTRIASCLKEFNWHWARRVLAQGAHVILMTDGLERDDAGELGLEMARLKRQARRVIWLNPLLRFDGFEPKATGVRAILPHVDSFRPVHNLTSLADLARALTGKATRAQNPREWMKRAREG